MAGSHQLINFTDDDRSALVDIGRPEGGQDSKSGQRQKHPASSPLPSMGLLYVASVQQFLESFAVSVLSEARTLQIVVLWVMTPCSLVRVRQRFNSLSR